MVQPSENYELAYEDVPSEDRISNLPRCLISSILSLLPTEDAVATSILSTRWRNLWTLITSLDFNDRLVRNSRRGYVGLSEKQRTSFTNFVYQVLLQCRSLRLCRFNLKCSEMYDSAHVIAWLSTALRCKVQNVDISMFDRPGNFSILPWNLYFCGTLVELKLRGKFIIDVPTSICLPCLKVLCLAEVKLSNGDSISRLIGSCSVVEELSLSECSGKVDFINISSPLLVSLKVYFLKFERDNNESRTKIVLDTPKLSYLSISDERVDDYQVKNLRYLSQASLHICLDEEDVEVFCAPLYSLLDAVSEVYFLELSEFTMEAIVNCGCQFPMFNNVFELSLGLADIDIVCPLVPVLLEKIPYLSTLTFAEGLFEFDEGNVVLDWTPPLQVPDCLLFHLKRIEIWNFKGSSVEQEMVGYFLKNAKVLEKAVIHFRLLHIVRASSICEVELL